MLYELAKKHAEAKKKMDEEEAPLKKKGPSLAIAIGVGKPKGDDALPPASEDIGEEEEEMTEAEPEGLFAGGPEEGDELEGMEEVEEEAENPDAAQDEQLIRKIVTEMLDERLGPL